MNEGNATQGVWLPLALADILTMLIVLYRILLAHPERVLIPERSEILHSWCLPMLSKALEEDEKERKAMEMIESVKRLNCKYNTENK